MKCRKQGAEESADVTNSAKEKQRNPTASMDLRQGEGDSKERGDVKKVQSAKNKKKVYKGI